MPAKKTSNKSVKQAVEKSNTNSIKKSDSLVNKKAVHSSEKENKFTLKRIAIIAIFAILLVSFVFWGITGLFTGGEKIIAKVGSKEIQYQEFNNEVSNISGKFKGAAVSEEDKKNINFFALTKLIGVALVEEFFKNNNFSIPQEALDTIVAKDPNLQTNGKFDQEKFKNFLKQIGVSEEKYFEQVKLELYNRLLSSMFSAKIGNTEIAKIIAASENEIRTVDLYTLPLNSLAAINNPSQDELQKFYQTNSSNYTVASKKTVLSANLSDNISPKSISEEEIVKLYKEKFNRPQDLTKYAIYNLVFNKKEDAEEVFKNANGNIATLVALAEKKLAKAEKDLLIKDVKLNLLSTDISKVISTLTPGQFSTPTQTSMGYHIFAVKEKTTDKPIALSTVKDKISNYLKQRGKCEEARKLASSIETAIDEGKKIEDIAKSYQLSLQTIEVSQNIPVKLSTNNELNQNLLNEINKIESQSSKIIPHPATCEFALISVTKIIPQRLPTLDEISGKVAEDWKTSEAKKSTENIVTKVTKNGNIDFDLATKNGFQKIATKSYTYNGEVGSKTPTSPDLIAAIFDKYLPNGDIAKSNNDITRMHKNEDGAFYFAVIKSVNYQSQKPIDQQKLLYVSEAISEGYGRLITNGFFDYLAGRYKIDIKNKELRDLFAKNWKNISN